MSTASAKFLANGRNTRMWGAWMQLATGNRRHPDDRAQLPAVLRAKAMAPVAAPLA